MKRLLLVLIVLLALPSVAQAGWGRYYRGYYGRPYAAFYGPRVFVPRPIVMPYRAFRPVIVAPAYPVYGYPAYGYGYGW
jgi:hypothetical protein